MEGEKPDIKVSVIETALLKLFLRPTGVGFYETYLLRSFIINKLKEL